MSGRTDAIVNVGSDRRNLLISNYLYEKIMELAALQAPFVGLFQIVRLKKKIYKVIYFLELGLCIVTADKAFLAYEELEMLLTWHPLLLHSRN